MSSPQPDDRSRARARWSRAVPAWLRMLLRRLAGAAVLAGVVAIAVALLAGVAFAIAYPNLPEIDELTDYRPRLPLRVYSSDGVLLGEYGEERRHFLPLDEIPQVMQDALLSVEDARFHRHGGIDYLRVLGAGLRNLAEPLSQGASTITMQVARNFYLPTEKTFTRKLYEMLLALKIESQLSKRQILEAYMNQIYLGQRAFGFAAASEIYFGKRLDEITLAEVAMLAGLPQAPATHNPIVNPQRARERQLVVLERMYRTGVITLAQRDAARNEPLRYRDRQPLPVYAEHVAETARQLVFSHYGSEAYTRGLNVHLTVDSREQLAAYQAVRRGVLAYESQQPYRGPEGYVDLPAQPGEVDDRVAQALEAHPDNDDLLAAVVLDAARQQVVAMLRDGRAVAITGEGLRPAAAGLQPNAGPKIEIRRGAVVRVQELSSGTWALAQLPEVEAAFVALDPRNGAVRAWVGGFTPSRAGFNRVSQAWRQPGSGIKPFVYSAALERGFTAATVIDDAPLVLSAAETGGQPWEPRNYDDGYQGPMSLRRTLAASRNLPAVRLLQAIGAPYAQSWLERFGFDPQRHPPYPSMVLGAGSTTPLELARAYAVFANGGYQVEPVLVRRLTDAHGRVLKETLPQAPDEGARVIDARNAFLMNDLLGEVTRSGTAMRVQEALHRPDLHGKTGTTNDAMDAWFAGYQATVAAVAWMGYDTPRKLGDRASGGSLALPIWVDYMRVALEEVPVAFPAVPDGLVSIDGEWYFEEFTPDTGIRSLGLPEVPASPTEEEQRSILDLFRN